MKEFNYVRAHAEWAEPNYRKLSDKVKAAYAGVVLAADRLHQNGASPVEFPEGPDGEKLRELFAAIPAQELADAAVVIHDWGHWGHTRAATVHYPGMPPRRFEANPWDPFSPARDARRHVENLNAYGPPDGEVRIEYERAGPIDKMGSHWKFEHLVRRFLFTDTHTRKVGPLSADAARSRLGWPEDGFMDHKPGTDYDDDEMADELNKLLPAGSLIRVREVVRVNYRVETDNRFGREVPGHPFTIGPKHLQGDSIHLYPRSAPCAAKLGYEVCGYGFDAHKSDRAALLTLARDLTGPELKAAFEPIREKCEEFRIDGLGFPPQEHKLLADGAAPSGQG